MRDEINKRGATYRPVTKQTYDAIQKLMRQHEMSWNATVNYLVLAGIRAEEDQGRNGGHW